MQLAQVTPMFLDVRDLAGLPNPLDDLYWEIRSVTFVLLVTGIIIHAWQNRESPIGGMQAILRAGVLTAVMAALPLLQPILQDLFFWPAQKLGAGQASINSSGDALRRLVSSLVFPNGVGNIFTLSSSAFTFFFGQIVKLFATIASLIIVPFYFAQYILQTITWSFMPIAIGCMMIPALKDKAQTFILSALSVFAWPLGLTLVNIFANQVITIAVDHPPPAEAGILAFCTAPLVIGFLLIGGTMSVPLITYFVFTSGSSYAGMNAASGAMSRLGSTITSRIPH